MLKQVFINQPQMLGCTVLQVHRWLSQAENAFTTVNEFTDDGCYSQDSIAKPCYKGTDGDLQMAS